MTTARTLLTLFAAAVIGLIGYEIGISQNIAAQIPPGAAQGAYWYGPHFGFGGFFGLFFGILILFLFIGLLRAAMWGGRGWHGGHGYGSMSEHRRARFEELHRELHGETPRSGDPSTST